MLLFFTHLYSQKIQILSQGTKISFRGLSIKGNTIWVSGSGGTVGKSADGGATWLWHTVAGYEKKDFRDIEALDENTAIVIAIASPAYILKTTDGGNSWKKVYENNHPAMFLDAVAFKNKNEGIVIGDPIDNNIFVAETKDGGENWQKTNRLALPEAIEGEAFFAASGNYNELQKTDSVFVYSNNSGASWKLPETMPSGYRSSVCFIGKNKAVTCGITGIDISEDGGVNWKKISSEGFNTCAYNRKENAVYFAGNNGRLGKLQL